MTFLAPYLLFAASAILIPIAIHLWNKRQGKTVKVGSLRWLEASASNRWSSIKLNNFWLLVLRCLIFILLAVALAQPVWVRNLQKPKGAKAIVVGEELLYTSGLKPIKPTIDSLLQRGYSLHSYTSDFNQISQEEWQQISSRTEDSTLAKHENYWNLLPALGAKYKLPQDSVWLFTSDQQQYFAGSRPDSLPQHIRWIPVATEASITWLQAAIQTSPDSLLLILGHTSREGTSYSKYEIASSTQSINMAGNKQLQLQLQQDTLAATFEGHSSNVYIQTEPLQVAILANKVQQVEVRYIKVALQAISSYTGVPISISQQDTAAADFFFWLKAEKLSESMLKRVEQGAQVWLQLNEKTSQQKVSMAPAGDAEVQARQLGIGKIYTYNKALVRNEQLPELLLPLLLPSPATPAFDLRAVDERQFIPAGRTAVAAGVVPEEQREPLLKWFVLAAFGLFLIERVVASRRSKV